MINLHKFNKVVWNESVLKNFNRLRINIFSLSFIKLKISFKFYGMEERKSLTIFYESNAGPGISPNAVNLCPTLSSPFSAAAHATRTCFIR